VTDGGQARELLVLRFDRPNAKKGDEMATTTQLDREEVRALVADALDVDVEDVTDTADFIDDLGVDSLMALEIMVRLEKKYGFKLAESEFKRINNFDTAFRILTEKMSTA
jgi:acyl carrier protein